MLGRTRGGVKSPRWVCGVFVLCRVAQFYFAGFWCVRAQPSGLSRSPLTALLHRF